MTIRKLPIAPVALVALPLLLSATLAAAQPPRDAVDRARDHRELRRDAAALADDRADVDRLSDLVFSWQERRDAKAPESELAAVMDRIMAELRRDVWEAHGKVVAERVEVRRDSREVRGDDREVRQERREVAEARKDGRPDAVAHERRDLQRERGDRRDDRRDRRGDIRDQRRAAEILVRKHALAGELARLQRRIDDTPHRDPRLLARQEKLLRQYLQLSREEIRLGVREVREDRREIREEHREEPRPR